MKEMICICCPLGCHLVVDDSDLNNIKVSGNTCPRGKKYGIDELTNPKRMVTSIVNVNGGEYNVVSVKTREALPKDMINECLNAIKNVTVDAPVDIGQVIISNVCNSGVDIVATKNVAKED